MRLFDGEGAVSAHLKTETSNSRLIWILNIYSSFPDTIYHSHQQQMSDLVSPYHCQHLVVSLYFILAILITLQKYLIIVLICIYLMANKIEYHSMYLCVPLKCPLKSFSNFLISLVFLILSF